MTNLPGRVDVNLGGRAGEQIGGQHRVDDVLHHALFDLGVGDAVSVLRADEHRIHAHRLAVSVFDRHLALAVGAQPRDGAVLALFCQLLGQLVRQVDGVGIRVGVSLQAYPNIIPWSPAPISSSSFAVTSPPFSSSE